MGGEPPKTTAPGSQVKFRKLSTGFSYEPSWNFGYSRSLNFVGREGVLERLDQQLQTGSRAIVVLTGMFGVGKTEVAIQYASQFGKNYSGGCYWLDMRDSLLANELMLLIKEKIDPELLLETTNQTKLSQYCWEWWEKKLPKDSTVLVVLDNVDEPAQIGGMLPASNRFRLLITTRKHALDVTFDEEPLNELTDVAGMELLTKLVGNRVAEEPEAAIKLYRDILGNLPLGIELAGRYLQQDDELSLSKYIENIEKLSIQHESLDRGNDVKAKYPTMNAEMGVKLALEMSWERLGSNSQRVAQLLELYALKPIPWELAVEMAEKVGENLESIRLARQQLANLNLIKWNKESKTASLHVLVRSFFHFKAQDAANFQQVFAQIMLEHTQQIEFSMTLEQVIAIKKIIPHIEEVANHYYNNFSDDNFFLIFVGAARFYTNQGIYEKAEYWYQQNLKTTKNRLGKAHIKIASCLNSLSTLYYDWGRYIQAKPLLEEALKLTKNHFGERNEDVASCLSNLGLVYCMQKNFSKSESFLQKALAIRKDLLGENHLDTATTLNNLAALHSSRHNYLEAEKLLEKVLNIRKTYLGCEHSHVADALNNLAYIYQMQKRYEEGEIFYKQALKIRKNYFGDSHRYVGESLYNLGILYDEKNQYQESKYFLEQALVIFDNFLGSRHCNTISARTALKNVCNKLEII